MRLFHPVSTLIAAIGLAASMTCSPVHVHAAETVTILGGTPGGLWAIMTEGLGECMRRSMPGVNVTTEPGKDGPNQVLVGSNKVPFGVAHEALGVAAVKGEPPFKKAFSDLRSVNVLNPTMAMQFIVDAKTGLKSIADIKEKKYPLRIAVNRQGTMMDLSTIAVFKAYGFSYDDIVKWGGKVYKIPGPEAIELWDAGQMDAIVEMSQFPASRFFEHSTKHDLRIFSVDKDKIDAINKELGTSSIVIPANTYPFQKEDVLTPNTKLVLLTNAQTPGSLVKDLLRSMVENIEYLHNVHANLRNLSPKTMSDDLKVTPHPAAAEFYKEILSK